MELGFSNTFFDSLKRLVRRERWYFKLWEIFRRKLPRFFKNIWIFRKVLWNHEWWDWRYTMEAMHTSISVMEKGMHKGLEIRESRDKKIEKMQRSLYLIERFMEDDFIDLAESELGNLISHDWEFEDVEGKPGFCVLVDKETPEEKIHNKKIYERAKEIEELMWIELWDIFKGQDYSKFNEDKDWNDQFDGSGMRGWWD